jgi:5-methylcytosine-specific restriction protein A
VFVIGQTYIRRALHSQYGGQKQGGISTPTSHPFVLLFTGEQGEQYGYRDGWTDDGVFFLYTCEGQVGDMMLVRGNRAILQHTEEGKDLHLFKYVGRSTVQYVGQMVCTGYEERAAPDRNRVSRKVIVFELTPVSAFAGSTTDEFIQEEDHWAQPLSVLRERALAQSATARNSVERKQAVRYRSDAIRVYVLKRADGICKGCGMETPFTTTAGRPYLEPHHIRRLSDGGPDQPEWVAGLCPNCHRRSHYGSDRESFNEKVTQTVQQKEVQLTNST